MSIYSAVLDVGMTTNVDKYFDLLFGEIEKTDFVWGEPNGRQFKEIMTNLESWCRQETKAGDSGRSTAITRADLIKYIREKVVGYPEVRFAGIHAAIYGIQLALRVRRPRCIDQGDTGLCGAVAAVYLFAKNNPKEFVAFALDLFFLGRGKFGGLDIEPSKKIRASYRHRRDMIPWAFDYVVLVSLRQSTFNWPGSTRGADETCMPGELARWLRDAGYQNVEDHTFFGKNQTGAVKLFGKMIGQKVHGPGNTAQGAVKTDRLGHAGQSLLDAEMALANGKVVVLFAKGSLTQALKDGESVMMTEVKGPVGLGKHHWTVIKFLAVTGPIVTIKVVSWGGTLIGTFKLDAFISRYGGYVCADPGLV